MLIFIILVNGLSTNEKMHFFSSLLDTLENHENFEVQKKNFVPQWASSKFGANFKPISYAVKHSNQ